MTKIFHKFCIIFCLLAMFFIHMYDSKDCSGVIVMGVCAIINTILLCSSL